MQIVLSTPEDSVIIITENVLTKFSKTPFLIKYILL